MLARIRDRVAGHPRAPLIVGLCAAGLLLGRYLMDFALWRDELALAVSVVRLSGGELAGPLAYGQEAPYGFLLLQKLAVSALGDSELAHRLVPLLFGLATLPLVWGLARRFFEPRRALLAYVVFVTGISFYDYATQAKQYAGDLAAAACLSFLGVRLLDRARQKDVVLLAGAGALAVWVSHAAVFVLAGVGTALLVSSSRQGFRDRGRLALLGAVWVASFATVFFLFHLKAARSQLMETTWAAQFLPLGVRALGWIPTHLHMLFRIQYDFPVPVSLLAMGLSLVGLWSLVRRDLARAFLLAGPIVFALIASALRLYPFTDRFVVFSTPALAILIVLGLEPMLASHRAYVAAAGLALAATIVVGHGVGLVRGLPAARENVRPLLQQLDRELADGDAVYVFAQAAKAFDYYDSHFRLSRRAARAQVGSIPKLPEGYIAELRALEGSPRVWVLASRTPLTSNFDDLAAQLRVWCPNLVGRSTDDVALYRCDLKVTPARAP